VRRGGKPLFFRTQVETCPINAKQRIGERGERTSAPKAMAGRCYYLGKIEVGRQAGVSVLDLGGGGKWVARVRQGAGPNRVVGCKQRIEKKAAAKH